MEMGHVDGSVMVMPPIYEIQLGLWRWCKLNEACAIVPGIARLAGVEFTPTPELLVDRFAALVRRNRGPVLADQEKKTEMKKIFRYSVDGVCFWGTEVLVIPKTPFQLEIGVPYPRELFVPEGWVIDMLKAVRRGVVQVEDWGGGGIIGFHPKPDENGRRFGRFGGGILLGKGEKPLFSQK